MTELRGNLASIGSQVVERIYVAARLRLSEFSGISTDEQSFHNPAECCAQDFKNYDLEHFDNLDNFLSKMSPVEKAFLFHITGYLTYKENLTPRKQQNSTVTRAKSVYSVVISRNAKITNRCLVLSCVFVSRCFLSCATLFGNFQMSKERCVIYLARLLEYLYDCYIFEFLKY